jgi:hypothetical protein
MPNFNGTGPRGMGSMTGGGRGLCSPYGMRAAWRPYRARRWAGYGYAFGAITAREQELDFLKGEAQDLKRTLEEIDARIKELTGEGK